MDYNYYFNEVMHHEWVMSNSKGGYSMGCGNFINKRKYNGILTASDGKLNRSQIVHAQEEKVRWRSKEVYLDSNNYSECIYPDGYEHIVKTWLLPYPAALYSSHPKSDDFLIFKEIKMHPLKNITMVSFSNLSSTAVEFEIRPKFSLRSHHSVNHPSTWDHASTEQSIEDLCARFTRNDNGLSAHMAVSCGEITAERIVFRNVFYPSDAVRGYDSTESVISPFLVKFTLEKGEKAYILYSDEPVENPAKRASEINKRYSKSIYPKDHPVSFKTPYTLEKVMFSDDNLFALGKYGRILDEMFDTFLVKDDIIAGFPWFSAWGRDTMISLKALFYRDKAADLYVKILEKYGKKIRKGVLPNVIGEGGEGTNYSSVDASLWFAVRLGEIYPFIENDKTKKKLFKYLTEIIGNYAYNKLLPFFCDTDGLIEIKYGDDALTWMDAKVYNKPVTPRWGKPVEINALWYNALKFFENISKDLKIKDFSLKYMKFDLKDIKELIAKIENSAPKFIINGHLADRVENNTPMDDFRPNVIIASSLPHKLWNEEIIQNSFDIVKQELLTPYGIRTLTPRNSSFKKKYIGSQTQLDMAYHQGTVWAWLLGPFVETFVFLNRKKMKKAELTDQIELFVDRLKQGILKGHISSVAEVWDGENPHFPKGCCAQAWSVAALITAEHIFDRPGGKQ